MFTGIIEHIGTIRQIEAKKNLLVFSLDLGPLAAKVKPGDSVAVNGVCLTVASKQKRMVNFELMKETIAKTSLQAYKPGDRVNLELALRAGGRMGGHFVTGHVDEVSVIKNISKEKNWVAITLSMSPAIRRYLAPKGSVTLDGISLTVGKVIKNSFEVYLIPYTLKVTNLGLRRAGDLVNIETDILAKYLFGQGKL